MDPVQTRHARVLGLPPFIPTPNGGAVCAGGWSASPPQVSLAEDMNRLVGPPADGRDRSVGANDLIHYAARPQT